MQVHRDLDQLPSFNNAVITIGTFDGVHAGHRKIIDALVLEARAAEGESVIITFHPHPRKIIHPDAHLQLINTLEEKIELLHASGIDHLVVVPFTREFSEIPADDYIADFLIKKFRPHTIIIGYDHHFGKERKGNFMLLAAQADRFQYKLLEIPRYLLNEIAVSSTKIRDALLESSVEEANRLLGYPYFFKGIVVRGDQMGRKLGYPTANLEYTDTEKIHLGHGVYAVHVEVDAIRKKGMLSIGTRPTLNGSDERVEVHIFDFDAEIYGHLLRVTVRKFLRAQEKFATLEELKTQMALDQQNSLLYL
jgi:riboflavin kinase / FMN adenylyltransferase